MRTYDANAMTYERVELFDKIAVFTEYMLDTNSIPEGIFCYDLRGSVDDSGIPITLEKYVEGEYYCGTLLFKENIDLGKSKCLDIYEKIDYTGKYL